MTGFRVAEHHAWRHAAPEPQAAPGPSRDGSDEDGALSAIEFEAPVPSDSAAPFAVAARLRARVAATGPIGWPARAHDAVFGAWLGGGVTSYAVRFLVVLAAVLLLLGGATGSPAVAYEHGEFRAATPSGVVHMLTAPGSAQPYPVQVRVSGMDQPSAWFDPGDGAVLVPTMAADAPAYALGLVVVRLEPGIEPVVMMREAGHSYASVSPVSDDGVTMVFPPLPLDAEGEFGVLIRGVEGRGPVELQMSVMRAPLVVKEDRSGAALPVLAGGSMGFVLLGAYAPGARDLRRARDVLRSERLPEPPADVEEPGVGVSGYARIRKRTEDLVAWRPKRDGEPERLAKLPGRGLVIRLD